MVYGDFKYLTRRTASDKILRDTAFNTAKNSNYGGYQRELVYTFFNKNLRRWFKHKNLLAVVLKI